MHLVAARLDEEPDVGAPIDANGNLTSDGTRTFEWDARNQLVAVTVGTHRSEFKYNGFQRRVATVERENGSLMSQQDFVWCGPEICEERTPSGVIIRRAFTLGEQSAGVPRFFTKDHIGTVADVSDASAGLIARYAFDPWGRRTLAAGQDLTTVGFTGHRWQAPGSLWLTMYRGYDADLGRWISEDPIKLAGGINMYSYVASSPVRYVDPLGLQVAACKRPLYLPGCDPENNVRCGPDWSGNPLYHAFLCVPDGKGGWECGGQQGEGGASSSADGEASQDTWPSNAQDACRIVDSRKCVEDCVRKRIRNPQRPTYGVTPLGTDCQEWRDQVLWFCKFNCWRP